MAGYGMGDLGMGEPGIEGLGLFPSGIKEVVASVFAFDNGVAPIEIEGIPEDVFFADGLYLVRNDGLRMTVGNGDGKCKHKSSNNANVFIIYFKLIDTKIGLYLFSSLYRCTKKAAEGIFHDFYICP